MLTKERRYGPPLIFTQHNMHYCSPSLDEYTVAEAAIIIIHHSNHNRETVEDVIDYDRMLHHFTHSTATS